MEAIESAARLAREACPGARELHLEPANDADGYMLNDVTLADGSLLTDAADSGAFIALAEQLHPVLSGLDEITDGGGNVHVTEYGAVTIDLRDNDAERKPAGRTRPRTATVGDLRRALEQFDDDAPVYLADCGHRSYFRHALDADDVTDAEIAGDEDDADPDDPDAPASVYIKIGAQLDYLPGPIRDRFNY